MSDDQISVELVAKVDQLNAGLKDGVSAVKSTVESMAGDLHKLEEHAEHSESILKEILSGEAFLVFKEKAEMAIEAVKEAFETLKESYEKTVVAAEEFGLSNAKFAAMMGTSEEEAAGLSAALRGVGSSSQEYESMAMRLEMRLKTQEGAFKSLGMTTRDEHGQMMSGQELMESAIKTMGEYKSGTDANAFALDVFGKRASAMYDIMRAGKEDVEHQIEIYKDMGVQLTGTGESSQELEALTNDLQTEIQALGLRIGQELLPYAKEAMKWMGTEGKGLLKDLADVVVELVQTFLGLVNVMAGVASFASQVGDAFSAIGASGSLNPNDATSGGLGPLVEQAKEAPGPLQRAAEALGHLGEKLREVTNQKTSANLMDLDEGGGANPYVKPGGTRSFVAPGKKGKGGADKSESAEVAGEEKLALARVKIAEDTNKHLLSMGQETEDAFLAQARELEDKTFLVKNEALHKQLELHGQTKSQIEKLHAEIELLELTHQGALLKIDQEGETARAKLEKQLTAEVIKENDAREKAMGNANKRLIKESEASTKEMSAPIAAGFKTTIRDMVTSGKSFHDAMTDMAKSIESSFLDMCLNIAQKWVETSVANAAVGHTTAVAQISDNTAVGVTGAVSSQASIPFIGPALAAAAGAAMLALMAGYGSIAHASGGMTVDRDQLVYAHKEEMILPAHLSKGIQAMISGGGGGGGGGTNVHYAPTINAPQGSDLAQLIRDQPRALIAAIMQARRDGAL